MKVKPRNQENNNKKQHEWAEGARRAPLIIRKLLENSTRIRRLEAQGKLKEIRAVSEQHVTESGACFD
jgi:hypothetical protein